MLSIVNWVRQGTPPTAQVLRTQGAQERPGTLGIYKPSEKIGAVTRSSAAPSNIVVGVPIAFPR